MSLSVAITHRLAGFTLDASFDAPPGVTVLFGRSGSGKTSVINAVAGLLRPEQGQIRLNGLTLYDSDTGQNLPVHKRQIGYVFQDARLFPHLSVRQNLTFGRRFSARRAAEPTLERVVEMLGLGDLTERRPISLSGGEKQRVAIGRALLAGSRMILADEPLAALDEARKADILPYFERLRDEFGMPILYVTHSVVELARLANSVVVLDRGRVIRQGTADEVMADPEITPTGVRAAGALLSAHVAKHHDDGLTELDAGGTPLFLPRISSQPGTPVRVRVVAHDVILSRTRPTGLSALNILSGRVTALRSGDGPGVIVSLSTPAGTVLARVTRRSAQALELVEGVDCFAVIKTVAIAPGDIGHRSGTASTHPSQP